MIGRIHRDDNNFLYLIPELFVPEFQELVRKMKQTSYNDNPYLFDDFDEFFGKYMVLDLSKIKCIMDNEI